MSPFRILSLLLLLAGPTVLSATAQNHPIYKLEERLMRGDKTALWEIAPYFDNKEQIAEFLGYHYLEPMLCTIAKRIVKENCLFTNEEIVITDSTTAAQFTNFLNRHKESITFSPLATSFLITPLEKRKARFEVRAITEIRRKQLLGSSPELMTSPWIHKNNIDSLILQKKPKVLLLIASELYRARSRYNRYHFKEKEYLDLITILTETEVGVENERKEIEWRIDKNFYPDAQLNLLIYFSNHYSQYAWDNERNVFANSNNVTRAIGKEEALIQLFSHNNKELAIDAFIQLTACDPEKIKLLVQEYDKVDLERNIILPTFPYRFLKQLSILTDWCRNHSIDYTGSVTLKKYIDQLRSNLSYKERYSLENTLINTLTLEEITAFEYWSLIYQQSWDLTYSAGRILDIFYSKNWENMLNDKKQWDCFLKKSALFSRLGIIGTCNKYLVKFSNSSSATLKILNNYPSTDKDIQFQASSAVAINRPDTSKKKEVVTYWEGNNDDTINNLKQQISQLKTLQIDTWDIDQKIAVTLSKISYAQIPEALASIEDYSFKYDHNKYTFLESDWGLGLAGNFLKKEIRDKFLQLYSKSTEYQLYAYYLDQSGINYKYADQTLHYDRIYQMLKYDGVIAFTGGGGGKRDKEIYPLIKLLELTFKTTLGFPRKLCQSQNMYACYTTGRAKAWMQYLKEKKLLTKEHNDPVSFTYE